jgi:hypothetical protein
MSINVNQQQSMAINSNPWQSTVIHGNQQQSMSINSNPWQSAAILAGAPVTIG